MENVIRRIAFHMECSPQALGRIIDSSLSQSEVLSILSRKIRRKNEGHMARSPKALSRVLPLELKGHLDCGMCPEWVLKLVVTHRIDLM
jgi:hypothetical protein